MLKIKEISICVSISRESKYPCEVCTGIKERGSIQIHTKRFRRPIHLSCYQPDQYIIRKNVKLPVRFPSEKQREFDTWFEIWNSRYIPLDKPWTIQDQYLEQSVTNCKSSRKRLLLQVFKFFSAEEIGLTLALVSKEFYAVSWEEELWQCLTSSQYSGAKLPQLPTWRETLLWARSRSCAGCGTCLDDDQFRICLLVMKPLWAPCLNYHPHYKLVSVYTTNEKYGISYNRNLFPTAMTEDSKFVTCSFLAELAVFNQREVVKQDVINEMHRIGINYNTIMEINYINTTMMDAEDSNSIFSRFRSNNTASEHTELYNYCFETIRSGFKDAKFSSKVKTIEI